MTKQLYTSQCNAWPSMAITDGTHELWYNVQWQQVPNVCKGQVYHLIGEAEARNDNTNNVELIAAFFASYDCYLPFAAPDQTGKISVALNGSNIVPAEHYGAPCKSMYYTATQDADYAVFYYCLRARWSVNNGQNILTLPAGTGSIQVYGPLA